MFDLPIFTTERLLIRPFVQQDLDRYHQINVAVGWAKQDQEARQEYHDWLDWTVCNYIQLARLHQPPYGDRAVVLREENRLIGGVGLVPYVAPFGQLQSFGGRSQPGCNWLASWKTRTMRVKALSDRRARIVGGMIGSP